MPDGKVVYPPLWGPRSYNWGAGMARIDLAAGFVRANMPFDQPGTLTDQQARDVAAFIDSHERPKDPRQTGSVAENAKANFSGQKSYYGQIVGGKLLGTGVPGER
jgi:thiosulfate dehydrogenase